MAKKKLKILIVEDDKYIQKAMNIKFTSSGFKVKLAASAEAGIKMLKNWLPDVIILDILLPGIDGYAFIRSIRVNNLWKKIPIIISSNLEEDKNKKIDVEEYIVKSDLDLDKLVAKVRSHIT